MSSETDFLLEKKLKELRPDYHDLFSATAFVSAHALDKYRMYFPDYTDHSILHAMQVIDFCNRLIGPENIDKLNADEIYILLESAYLHDSGMGISESDYLTLKEGIVSPAFIKEHPDYTTAEIIRTFHNEFSGMFIRKYAALLEIPSEKHVYAIVQVSRGHRKTDLFDENEYPSEFLLDNGNTVCLPYLASLIRLADELDIAADRNITAEFTEIDTIDTRRHKAIKHLRMEKDRFVFEVETDDDIVFSEVLKAAEKLQEVLDLCNEVLEKRTTFLISQKRVDIERIG